MDAALRQLLWLRLSGGVRQRIGQLASPAGLFSVAVLAAVVWLLLATDTYTTQRDAAEMSLDVIAFRENLADLMPFALLAATAMTVLLSMGSPIHYSAQEINFLLAGPFSRRSVLAYKFTVYTFGALVNAAIITLLLPSRGNPILATFAGTALSLLFIQTASTTLTLCAKAIKQKLGPRWRLITVLVFICLASLAVWAIILACDATLTDTLRQSRHHWIGEVSLAPFIVFVEIFLAQELGAKFIFWLSIGAGLNVLLIYAIFFLDRYSGEPSSIRRSLSGLRLRRAGPARKNSHGGNWSRHILAFSGIGPIVWRQLINALRGHDRVVLVWMTIAALAAPFIAASASLDRFGMQLGIGFFVATYILPKTLHLDFRNDLGMMEIYKALPLRPWQIFAGQIVVAAVTASLIELTAISGIFLMGIAVSALWLGVAALFILTFNLVFFALENLVFLLFPSPPVPVGRVDFEFIGRAIAEYFGKAVVMIAVLAASTAMGLKVLVEMGQGIMPAMFLAWLILIGSGLALICLGGLAFRRFDVSETIA